MFARVIVSDTPCTLACWVILWVMPSGRIIHINTVYSFYQRDENDGRGGGMGIGRGRGRGRGREETCTDKCPKRTENSEWSLACSTVVEVRKEHHHQHLLPPSLSLTTKNKK